MIEELTQVLAAARDPVLLVDGSGKLLGSNPPARHLFDKVLPRLGKETQPKDLGDILPAFQSAELLQTKGFAQYELELSTAAGIKLRQIVIVVDVSTADPDSSLLLLLFKTPIPGQLMAADEFAAIAHDLRNPLSAVFGYIDTLIETPLGANLNPKHRDVLKRVHNTVLRTIEMVKNLQQLFYLQTRRLRGAASEDLNAVIRNIVDYLYRPEAETPQLQLQLSAGRLPAKVESVQLDRIAANLIANALRYTPPTGRITVATERLRLSVLLRVTNDKPIIPAADLPLLFDRYRRGSTTAGRSGSGLGLYIVKSLVLKAGGTIRVDSSAEQGTVFQVELPPGEM